MKKSMRKGILYAVLGLLVVFVGCSDDDESQPDPLDGAWSIINISGGFAGIDDDYTQGDVVWNFDTTASKIFVQNNNPSNTIYDGLDSDEYPYTILTVGKEMYLQINGQEFGRMSLTQNTMSLNQNFFSTGNGADGFVLLFAKN